MDIEQHGYSEWLDSIEARIVGSHNATGPQPETRADGSPDLAWHRHTGERCMRAETTGDCPQNHRYGPTYERSI